MVKLLQSIKITRHKKNRCKKKGDLTRQELEIIIESRDQTIMELRYQIEKLLDKVGTTNHTTNNTFNFVVNAFGKEDTSYMPINIFKVLLKVVLTIVYLTSQGNSFSPRA